MSKETPGQKIEKARNLGAALKVYKKAYEALLGREITAEATESPIEILKGALEGKDLQEVLDRGEMLRLKNMRPVSEEIQVLINPKMAAARKAVVKRLINELKGTDHRLEKMFKMLEEAGLNNDFTLLLQCSEAMIRLDYGNIIDKKLENLENDKDAYTSQKKILSLALGEDSLSQDSVLYAALMDPKKGIFDRQGNKRPNIDAFARATHQIYLDFTRNHKVKAGYKLDSLADYKAMCKGQEGVLQRKLEYIDKSGLSLRAQIEARKEQIQRGINLLTIRAKNLRDQAAISGDAREAAKFIAEAERLEDKAEKLKDVDLQKILDTYYGKAETVAMRSLIYSTTTGSMEPFNRNETIEAILAAPSKAIDWVTNFIPTPTKFRDLDGGKMLEYTAYAAVATAGVALLIRRGKNIYNVFHQLVFKLSPGGAWASLKKIPGDLLKGVRESIPAVAVAAGAFALGHPDLTEKKFGEVWEWTKTEMNDLLGVDAPEAVKRWYGASVRPLLKKGKRGVFEFFEKSWDKVSDFSKGQKDALVTWAERYGLKIEDLQAHYQVKSELQGELNKSFGGIMSITLTNNEHLAFLELYARKYNEAKDNPLENPPEVTKKELKDAGIISESEMKKLSVDWIFSPSRDIVQDLFDQSTWANEHGYKSENNDMS